MKTFKQSEMNEARMEAQHAPGVDENDWCEGWDDAIQYLIETGVIKIEN